MSASKIEGQRTPAVATRLMTTRVGDDLWYRHDAH
jgi:hypothetical protein